MAPAHEPLDGEDRVLGVGDRLTLCHLPHEGLALFREGHHGGGQTAAFLIGDDDRLPAFHHGYDGVSRAQVDADDFAHMILKSLQNSWLRAAFRRLLLSSISVSMLSLLLSSLFACPGILSAGDSVEIVVAAASDLAPLEGRMRALVNGAPVRFVFGSSGQLASQIRAGAPYDVYMSASLDFVRELEKEGRLVVGTARAYARGRLALYSKDGKLTGLDGLASARAIAIANPAHAPYGVAARQVLRGRADWTAIEGKIVYAENVRQALQFAESGNADAALVAWSLVKGRPGAVLLAEGLHGPIVQGLGVVRGKAADAERTAQAMGFIAAMMGAAGQAMLAQAGFEGAMVVPVHAAAPPAPIPSVPSAKPASAAAKKPRGKRTPARK